MKFIGSKAQKILQEDNIYSSEGELKFSFDDKTKKYQYSEKSFLDNLEGEDYYFTVNYWGNRKELKGVPVLKYHNQMSQLKLLCEQSAISHETISSIFICFKNSLFIEQVNSKKNYDLTKSGRYIKSLVKKIYKYKYEPGKPIFTSIFKKRKGKLVFYILYPVYNSKNDLEFIVGCSIPYNMAISYIYNIFSEGEYEKYDIIKLFISNNGNILYLPRKYAELFSLPVNKKEIPLDSDKFIYNMNLLASSNPVVRELGNLLLSEPAGTTYIQLRGQSYLLIFYTIPVNKWNIILLVNNTHFQKPIKKLNLYFNNIFDKFIKCLIICFLVILVLGFIFSLFFFKSIFIKPVRNIRDKFNLLGKGNFNIETKEKGVKEIYDLSLSFNNVGKQLKNYTDNLQNEIKARQIIQTELKIAGEIQESVLPAITEGFIRKEFTLFARLISAKEMSGDFYDFFYVRPNKLALILADVSGKGITAAFYMSMSKAIIKEACLSSETLGPGKILNYVNKTLCRNNEKSMFLTLYLCIYNIDTGELEFSNAGHHEFTYLKSNGNISTGGILSKPAIGICEETEFNSSKLKIQKGSTVIFYTDGITEAPDSSNNEYGNERLEKIIEKNYLDKISDLGDLIIKDVLDFQKGEKFDDITLLMFRRNE
ncbi:MAG TPA: SpoIIE family protein phosphatase [Victivallales bacterium]|nr:SpoIIE family protein phosphatase [Victivallales bacterium]